MYYTSHFSAYNHGGLKIPHPRFPQEAIPRVMHGKIYIKIILIIIIQACQHTLIQEFHNILITTCHIIFIQAFHQTNILYVHISILILCMNLI